MRFPDEALVRLVEEFFSWLRTFGTGWQAFIMVALLAGITAVVIIAVRCVPTISAHIVTLKTSKNETRVKSKELDLEIFKRIDRIQRNQKKNEDADDNEKGVS